MRSDTTANGITSAHMSGRASALKLVAGILAMATLVIGLPAPAEAAVQAGIAVQCVDDVITGTSYIKVLDVFQRTYVGETGHYWLRVKRWNGNAWSTVIDSGWRKVFLAPAFQYLTITTGALANGLYTVEVYHSVSGMVYGPIRDADKSYDYLRRTSFVAAPQHLGYSNADGCWIG